MHVIATWCCDSPAGILYYMLHLHALKCCLLQYSSYVYVVLVSRITPIPINSEFPLIFPCPCIAIQITCTCTHVYIAMDADNYKIQYMYCTYLAS